MSAADLVLSDLKLGSSSSLSIGMLSTLPPTLCGLATFNSALESALVEAGHRVSSVRVAESGDVTHPSEGALMPGSASSRGSVARALSANDVVIIQHEFGIYGGPDGQEVLELLTKIRVPVVVVLHTVPARPSSNQLRILRVLARLANSLVVLSGSAQRQLARLIGGHFHVAMIPHGAATRGKRHPSSQRTAQTTDLLTWGLIGPGKGIEFALNALHCAQAQGVDLTYTIAGVTHPKVARRDGDAYVASLKELTSDLGIDHLVTFDHLYRGVQAMLPFIESAGAVVLPYESREQVTSGVLVDSLAAGRPVIATSFPHAVELLSNGSGLLVKHNDVEQLAAAMIRSHSLPARELMAAHASALAPRFAWSTVADQYVEMCTQFAFGQRLAI